MYLNKYNTKYIALLRVLLNLLSALPSMTEISVVIRQWT